VRNCLFISRSAFRWADWDVQTVFFGEQLPFVRSVRGLMDGLGCSGVFSGEQLPFGSFVSGPIDGMRCSDSVFW
jgi:hypothetical protein